MTFVAGCGSSGGKVSSGKTVASNAKYVIGVVSPGADQPFWVSAAEGAKAAGNKLTNATVTIGTAPSSTELNGMIPVIQNMETQGVNALVVLGIPQLLPALQHAKREHIPIIFWGSGLPGNSTPTSTVNTDELEGGERAGRYIKQQLKGTGTLALIGFPRGTYPEIDERFQGLETALKGSQVKIVAHLNTSCSPTESVAAAQNLLTREPAISAFFGECGTAALGAVKAIKQANIAAGKILVVGFDGIEPELDAIKAGEEMATVGQFPFEMGEVAVKTADEVLEGKSVPKNIHLKTQLITKENVVQALSALKTK